MKESTKTAAEGERTVIISNSRASITQLKRAGFELVHEVEEGDTVVAWLNEPGPSQRNLTRRQLEVLQLLDRGLSNDQVAAELSVTRKTVERHILRIRRRLSAATDVQLGLKAARRIDLECTPPEQSRETT